MNDQQRKEIISKTSKAIVSKMENQDQFWKINTIETLLKMLDDLHLSSLDFALTLSQKPENQS